MRMISSFQKISKSGAAAARAQSLTFYAPARRNRYPRITDARGSVSGEQTQLSPKYSPLSSTMACFLPGMTYFLADCMCRFRTRSRMFAFGWPPIAWEWLERTLGVLGVSFDAVIL